MLDEVHFFFLLTDASQWMEIFPQLANEYLFWCFSYEPLSQYRREALSGSFSPFALQPLILQSVFHLSYFSKHTI